MTPEEKAERQSLLESSDRELLGNLNYLHRKLNPAAKGKITKPNQLKEVFDASQIVCAKKGITAGFRRYEVLDGPLGRTVLVFAPNAVHQHGPLRWSIKTNFIWAKAGANIPARGKRGPHQPIQKKMWCESMPTRCHVVEAFVSAFNEHVANGTTSNPPIDIDLEGSYQPELREMRLRRLANLVIEITVPQDVCETPIDYRKSVETTKRLMNAGFGNQAELVKAAFACSELENTLLRANQMGWLVSTIFVTDVMTYMLFSMRIREVL